MERLTEVVDELEWGVGWVSPEQPQRLTSRVLASGGRVPDWPFEIVPLVRRFRWDEVALWWPERRVLVCADALGTVLSVRRRDRA